MALEYSKELHKEFLTTPSKIFFAKYQVSSATCQQLFGKKKTKVFTSKQDKVKNELLKELKEYHYNYTGPKLSLKYFLYSVTSLGLKKEEAIKPKIKVIRKKPLRDEFREELKILWHKRKEIGLDAYEQAKNALYKRYKLPEFTSI